MEHNNYYATSTLFYFYFLLDIIFYFLDNLTVENWSWTSILQSKCFVILIHTSTWSTSTFLFTLNLLSQRNYTSI